MAKRKLWRAVGVFTGANLVTMAMLHIADNVGVPHDVIAMVGLGFLWVSSLATVAYVLMAAASTDTPEEQE